MSHFIKITKHPITGFWQPAEWLDGYFRNHHYGVRFPDGDVFNPEVVELETKNDGE